MNSDLKEFQVGSGAETNIGDIFEMPILQRLQVPCYRYCNKCAMNHSLFDEKVPGVF